MILMDTGPLVALFNPSDDAHEKCMSILATLEETVCTTTPVLTEAFHLMHTINPGTTRPDGLHQQRRATGPGP